MSDTEDTHSCVREGLPKARKWRIGQIRVCRKCGMLHYCKRFGILTDTPVWVRIWADQIMGSRR